MSPQTVLLVGASEKKSRYAYKALEMLLKHEHNVVPFNPFGGAALNQQFHTTLDDIKSTIDTITLYVAPKRLEAMMDELIDLNPQRVIFNPGTEDEELMERFKDAGINVVEGCTLVMLSTNQF